MLGIFVVAFGLGFGLELSVGVGFEFSYMIFRWLDLMVILASGRWYFLLGGGRGSRWKKIRMLGGIWEVCGIFRWRY